MLSETEDTLLDTVNLLSGCQIDSVCIRWVSLGCHFLRHPCHLHRLDVHAGSDRGRCQVFPGGDIHSQCRCDLNISHCGWSTWTLHPSPCSCFCLITSHLLSSSCRWSPWWLLTYHILSSFFCSTPCLEPSTLHSSRISLIALSQTHLNMQLTANYRQYPPSSLHWMHKQLYSDGSKCWLPVY